MEVYRPKIEYFHAMYTTEPAIADIFVEGRSDLLFVKTILRELGVQKCVVREIDNVDVPVSLLNNYGMTEGAKARSIVFGRELERMGGVDTTSVLIIIDRDSDLSFSSLDAIPDLVVPTDASDLESFTLVPRVFDKVLNRMFHLDIDDPTGVIKIISGPLLDMAACRAALASLENPVRVNGDPCKNIDWDGQVGYLDAENFIQRSLGGAVVSDRDRSNLIDRYKEYIKFMNRHPINKVINGHDIAMALICWMRDVRRVRSPLYTVESAERALVTAIELQDLEHTALLRRIREINNGGIS